MILAGLLAVAAFGGNLQWVAKDPAVLELREDGKLVFAYHHGLGRACCYLHPLVSPGGVVLTDDGPVDHKHHRGLFWGWPIVEVGGVRYDSWLQSNIVHEEDGAPTYEVRAGRAVLRARHAWRAAGKVVMRDSVVITAGDGSTFEVALRLEAVGAPLELAGAPEQDKGYGGLSVRFAARTGTVVRSSEGKVAADENHGAHEWAELEGVFEGKRGGLRMTADRRNPGFPNDWCLRYYGFVGANFPGVKRLRMEPGKAVMLRYQVRLF